jgi:hypothetical protein
VRTRNPTVLAQDSQGFPNGQVSAAHENINFGA